MSTSRARQASLVTASFSNETVYPLSLTLKIDEKRASPDYPVEIRSLDSPKGRLWARRRSGFGEFLMKDIASKPHARTMATTLGRTTSADPLHMDSSVRTSELYSSEPSSHKPMEAISSVFENRERLSREMLASKIAELESTVATLETENARLRSLLESCSSRASVELSATIISPNARKLLQWLNNREPESLAAISFYLSIKKTLAADYIEELVRAELLTQISQNSLPDKWALSEIGKEFLTTTS